ncbi:MAG TPA: response regulator [Gemmatimonadales bacterium]|nr:response regulator [Gemmatimonadales bacterium]
MAENVTPRILLVDDDPDLGRLVQHVLGSSGYNPARQVSTGREALASLDDVDIVLLDQQLPDTSGLDVLDAIRTRASPPAVILVTGYGNESLVASALRRGADDYLAKDAAFVELLPQILERVRRGREMRKALAAAEQDLVRAERLAAVGEMTVTLHHEINNPLMAAFADVELLLTDLDASRETQRQGLEDIRQALRRIRDIVQRIGKLREIRSKDYMRGVRMLDLERKGREISVVQRGTVLLHLPDEDLARIISLLLRGAGFQVERCSTLEQLQQSAASLGVRVVVIAGGAGAPGSHPLGGFSPAKDRDYLLVALVAGDGAAAESAGADHVVHLPFDPGTFTAEIVHLLTAASPADSPSRAT